MSVIVFKVAEAERKVSKNDKPYARARADGLGWMSAWGADDANLLLSTPLPATFKGELTEKDGFKNLSGLTLAEGEAPTTSSSASSGSPEEKMSKDEWLMKEKRQQASQLLTVHTLRLVQLCEPGIGFHMYDQIHKKAREFTSVDMVWLYGEGELPF